MTKQRKAEQPRPLVADHIYREREGGPFFGYKPTQLHEKILSGEIPRPIPLSDSGRAVGWFGRQIMAWQAEREAAADRQAAAELKAPAEPKAAAKREAP